MAEYMREAVSNKIMKAIKLLSSLPDHPTERAFLHITAGACLKNHSCNLHAPLCGIFHPNSVVVARYDALIRAKSPTNCDAHLAESLFQTHSKVKTIKKDEKNL